MKTSKYILMLPAALLMLSACSDDLSGTEWSPGEQSNAPGVYFSSDNEKYMALLDGSTDAEFKVMRLSNSGSLTVPIVVKQSDPGMSIPASVTFADGSYETTLTVDCANVPAIQELPLKITFPDEYINPYVAGSPEYSGSLIVSKWENVSATGKTNFQVTTWGYKDAGYDIIESEMYHLLGSNRYRIHNFLNTDLTFNFELMESPYKANTHRIIPNSNSYLLSDYGWGDYSYYNAWWLVIDDFDPLDEEQDGWPDVVFTKPDGNNLMIYYLQFLWYDDATKSEYCYVLNLDKGTPTAYMAFYGNLDEDMETWSSYQYLKFTWTEDTASAD